MDTPIRLAVDLSGSATSTSVFAAGGCLQAGFNALGRVLRGLSSEADVWVLVGLQSYLRFEGGTEVGAVQSDRT